MLNDISLKCFNAELEKIAISAGLVSRAISGRLGRTLVDSPVKTQFIESVLPKIHPELRAPQTLRQQAATTQQVAPKGSKMQIGDYKSRIASHESGMPLGNAPKHQETVAEKPKRSLLNRFGRSVAMGGILTGAALVGGSVEAFRTNPYAGTEYNG